jgi:hypothetical protein
MQNEDLWADLQEMVQTLEYWTSNKRCDLEVLEKELLNIKALIVKAQSLC